MVNNHPSFQKDMDFSVLIQRKMKMKYSISVVLAVFAFLKVNAQVKDISVTISPAAEYTWWDDQSGLNDGPLIGGRIGFGFGEYVELRGSYFQSLDLTTNFEDFGLENYNADLFTEQNVTLKRWGGEFKANIGTKKLMPYLTLGSGVQSIQVDGDEKAEQIYASLGLGIKLKISDRAVFLLEGKNTMFNFNSGANLLTDDNKTNFGVSDADFASSRLSNWGVQGSLQFYLGGRRPGTLTDLDQAYLDKFKGGFRGLQLIVEPSLNYLAFDDNSQFRDTYLLGGYAGIDFNEYVGLRGFYFQATQNEAISTDFDELAMYGLEFRARLNDGNGVTPYLVLGGGYMNAYDSYLGKDNVAVDGSEFASGGLGLNIPLGRNLLITGGVRAIVTSGQNIEDLAAPSDIQTHIMYNAGLKFVLGRKSRSPQEVYDDNLNEELDAQQLANDQKIQQMKTSYQSRVDSLQTELKTAYQAKDVDKAIELMEEKKQAEEDLKEVEKLEKVQEGKVTVKAKIVEEEVAVPVEAAPVQAPEQSELIRMTPAEFESLIDRILKGMDEAPETQKVVPPAPSAPNGQEQQIEFLNQRIDLLEKLLLEVNARKGVGEQSISPNSLQLQEQDRISDANERILDKLDDLNRKIDNNTDRIVDQDGRAATIVVAPKSAPEEEVIITSINENGEIIDEQNVADGERTLVYNYASGIIGFNYGGASTVNLGLRLHYDIAKTKLQFMPEAYVGVGEGTSFGLSGNVVYPIEITNDKIEPYIGAGLGFSSIADDTKGHYNIIIGSQLPFLHKNVYVDYTMRNSFDYNQLALGYRLSF